MSADTKESRSVQVIVALIGAGAVILAALIAANPDLFSFRSTPATRNQADPPATLADPKARAADDRSARSDGSQRLGIPALLSPDRGEVVRFRDNPTVTLRWSAVPRATAYKLEMERQQRGAFPGERVWSSFVGPVRVQTLVQTPQVPVGEYIAKDLRVARLQPVRWRVWAVGPDGKDGVKSDWQEFKFDWFESDSRRRENR